MHAITTLCLALATASSLAGPITTEWTTSAAALSVHDISLREFKALQCGSDLLGMSTWEDKTTSGCDGSRLLYTGLALETSSAPIHLHTLATPDFEQVAHGMTVVSDRRRLPPPVSQRREAPAFAALALR